MKFSLGSAAALLPALACAAQVAAQVRNVSNSGPAMLLPGSRVLAAKYIVPQTQSLRVLVRAGSGDTTEREWSVVTRSETVIDAPPGQIAQTFRYAPPRAVSDSLVVQRAGLAPVFEQLDLGQSRITLRYEGNRVLGSVVRGDSTAQFERNFSHDVFAFNQLESLVRTLDYKTGLSVVVPLFSEQDLKLEYDTLQVVAREDARGKVAWRVRFADAVVVSEYLVAAETRRVLSQETRQRASGTRFRYEVVAGQ